MINSRPNLYAIKGGIGKCVAFTALIDQLFARDGKKICVGSGFPGVFKSHPKVAATMNSITQEAITPVADKFDDIVFREPYISAYCKGDRHILDEWARLYGIKPLKGGGFNSRPELFLNQTFTDQALEMKAKLGRRFFIVQWTGGQPPQSFKRTGKYPDNYLIRGRNVKNYQEIMIELAKAYPEHLFVIYALPNEPVQMPDQIRSRCARAKAPTLAYAALLRHADSFIALDSSLQHFAAARQVDKKGVVLWGQTTTPEQIGYSYHTNLKSAEQQGGVTVPPDQVVTELQKIVKN